MSRTIKLLLTLSIITILLLGFNFVYATENNEDDSSISEKVEDNESNNEVENTSTENDIVNETSQDSLSTLSPSSVTSVSTVNSYEQANLDLNNILCIILIAIGVLLILFAIAILIRLKQ